MAKSFDPRRILENSIIYNTFQYIVGGVRARRLFVENDVRLQVNQKILDIGCGPGYLIDFLPNTDYTGIDIDANYIKTAKTRYPNDTFYCTAVEDFNLEAPNTFDVVIAAGVIHHLTDSQTSRLFELAKKALKPNGRLITLDGCYIEKQNPIAKKLLDIDRGQFVRTEDAYINLTSTFFSNVNSKIANNYFHIPYTLMIMECKN
ncbi:trans-aconitate 2-methyltransferase [Lacinutrix sp. 5H-3-7-4]|uniref:class I SAM-dependent methyltransferase n=1 Tax=Lacinutrix sp. (strain 5H-3-7-4) TaxID=983544 RepID=UPI00020A3C3C|nr:class I SAM-dependent methyltransferase [Lacinutrix sp. 5H-3-7-4]AEH01631.1 Methyltransferase type 12 [Lacinutrix sp. 5H-3-7-4]